MLGISPNTLRSWERRYDFPQPLRSPGGHRQYSLGEIEALRLTLAETHNVSSAISLARERGEGPSTSSRLASAFAAFDEDTANRLLEESLGLRSVERTIEEVLLEAVTSQREGDTNTVEYEFGWRSRWCCDGPVCARSRSRRRSSSRVWAGHSAPWIRRRSC